MLNLLLFLYIACVVSLLLLLLFQAGRSNELSLLGGGVNSALKPSSGGDFITKLTSYLVFGFIFLSLALTYSFLGGTNKKVFDSSHVDKMLSQTKEGVSAKKIEKTKK